MNKTFFFQTKQIPVRNKSSHGASLRDDSSLFDEFKKQKIYFSYFQVDQNYYLFVYAQKSIDINFLYQSIDVIQELDSKQRKIRSFRGFFLYALEIMQMGDNYEILKTNLQPFFWRKVKTIIRQNQKAALLEFLFGKAELNQDQILGLIPHLQDQMKALNNQVDSLQQKIIQLESKLENPKYALSEPSQPLEWSKTIQQGDSTLEGKKAPYLRENDPKRSSAVLSEIRDSTSRGKDMESKSFSDVPDINFQTFSGSQQYNISSASQIPRFKPISANQEKGLNGSNFITLGRIPEQEIIQRGFQLQAEGKISLKKYYEGVSEANSLFQLKGYRIKYEAIRKNKFYQQLKQ